MSYNPDIRDSVVNSRDFLVGGSQGAIRYRSLWENYAWSKYGEHHAGQPLRYSQWYGYDRSTMLADLGPDVHPLMHMTYTEAKVMRPLLEEQRASRDSKAEYVSDIQVLALRAGTLIHDIGECEHPEIAEALGGTVGDVHWELKKAEDEQQEERVRRLLYGKLFQALPPRVIELAEDVVAGSEDPFIKQLFNTAERIGYYTTAMTAGRIALEAITTQEEESERAIKLGRLGVKVAVNHHGVLAERSGSIPYAGRVLEETAEQYEQIIKQLAHLLP